MSREVGVLTQLNEILQDEHATVPDFLKGVLAETNKLIGSDYGCIGLVKTMGNECVVAVQEMGELNVVGAVSGSWRRYVTDFRVGGPDLPQKHRSFMGYVAWTRRSYRSANVKEEAFYRRCNSDVKSELAAPIMLDRAVLGVINLESRAQNFYTDAHHELLELVAQLVASPLARLLRREHAESKPAAVCTRIQRLLNDAPPIVPLETTDTLNAVAAAIAGALKSRSCTIWLLDAGRTRLKLCGVYGPHAKLPNDSEPRGPTVAWRNLRSRRTFRFGRNYLRDKASIGKDRRIHGKQLTTPMLISPLLSRGDAIGVVKLGLRKKTLDSPEGYYTERDEHLVNLLQGQIATAVEFRRLEVEKDAQAQEFRRKLSQLNDLFLELDLKTLVLEAAKRISHLCRTLHCSIFFWDQPREAYVQVASHGRAHPLVRRAAHRLGQGPVGWVGAQRKSLFLDRRMPGAWRDAYGSIKWDVQSHGAAAPYRGRHSLLFVPFGGLAQAEGVLCVSRRTGGPFTDADAELVGLIGAQIATAARYCRRYGDMFKLYKEMEILTRRVSQLESDPDLFEKAILTDAGEFASRALQADVMIVYKFRDGRFETPPFRYGELRHPEFMNGRLRQNDVPWRILREEPRDWADVQHEPIFANAARRYLGVAPQRFALREGVRSLFTMPLEVAGSPVGLMLLNFRRQRTFDEETKELMKTFAGHLALALEVGRLYQRGRDEEASQLAQELHDGVKRVASHIRWAAGTVRDFARAGKLDEVVHGLERIETLAMYCAQEADAVVGLWQNELLRRDGLAAALKWYFETVDGSGPPLHFAHKGQDDLPVRDRQHLYRVAQEAHGNAVAHARCNKIRISLDMEAERSVVTITISDDGVGFDREAVMRSKRAYGLTGMRDRVEDALKGHFQIRSQPGQGTTIVAEIPRR